MASPKLSKQTLDDIVVANRILSAQGVLDAWGHVSVRDPADPRRYWMSRSMAPALVTASEIMAFDLDSKPIGRQSRKMYIERFIHGEIYKARDDVAAVLHNHSPALIPFTVADMPLRPLTQVAGFLGSGVPVFDIRDVDQGADLLIANGEQASALAHTLGNHAVVLLRGHGAVVVANSLQQVVWRGIYAELNARQQLEALRLGSVRYLSAAEAEFAAAHVPHDPARPWQLWKSQALGR
jgi:HCOMODA/2-hydroxy-3-carboxy-muconic semialdehyde decarboxylase